jgi:hypothetical protein
MEPSEERARRQAEWRARKAAGDAEVDAFYRVDDDQYEAEVVDFGEQLRAAHRERLRVEARDAAESFDAAFRVADVARRARGDYSQRPGPTCVEEFEAQGLDWYTADLRRLYRQSRAQQQRQRPVIVRPTPPLGVVPPPRTRAPRERRDRPSSRSSPRSSRGSSSDDPDGEPEPPLAAAIELTRRDRWPLWWRLRDVRCRWHERREGLR